MYQGGMAMPAAYAHDIAALRAAELLGEDCPAWLDGERPAYLLGAQGPDVFFYGGVLPPWRRHYINFDGFRLHAQSGAQWGGALLAYCKDAANTARAWTLGYLCHWAVDAACHPYVLSREGEMPGAHGLIEMGADTLLYRQRGGEGVPRHLAYLSDLTKDRIDALCAMFARTLPEALPGRRVSLRQMRNVIFDAGRLYGFLHSPDGKRYRKLERIERLIGKPHLLSSHLPPLDMHIPDPLNTERRAFDGGDTSTYAELLEKGAKNAARSQRLALRLWRGELDLGEALSSMGSLRMEDGQVDSTK